MFSEVKYVVTYQEKIFFDLLEEFKKENLQSTQIRENTFLTLRNEFVVKFPKNSIVSMEMNDYVISSKNNIESFCRGIKTILKTFFKENLDTKGWENIFGIAIKNGTQLTVSKMFDKRVISSEEIFQYIKNQIINLLEALDKNNYPDIKSCTLHADFKYILLIIYCPEKVLPVYRESLLHRYCEALNLSYDDGKERIYYNNLLIQWKDDISVLSDWSYLDFVSFCDWLYRKGRRIDGNFLRQQDEQTGVNQIVQELENENLCGKSKEAIIKVRVNQGIFRKKLLQHYKTCCLCNVSNPKLLIASHIKPWSVCNAQEKVDKNNGFLMCPNHDALFDQGWITFNDDGKIIISDALSKNDRMAFDINENMIILLTDENKKYLRYHREEIFEKLLP